jgi:hypothetical protein
MRGLIRPSANFWTSKPSGSSSCDSLVRRLEFLRLDHVSHDLDLGRLVLRLGAGREC